MRGMKVLAVAGLAVMLLLTQLNAGAQVRVRENVVVVWDTIFEGGDPANRVVTYAQPGSWDFNLDIINATTKTVDGIEITLEGVHDIDQVYNGYLDGIHFGPGGFQTQPFPDNNPQIVKDVANNKTIISWFNPNRPITPNAPDNIVHIGARTTQGNAKFLGFVWKIGNQVAGKLPTVGMEINPQGKVVLSNAGTDTIKISNLRSAKYTGERIPLDQINARQLEGALSQRGARLEPTGDPPATLRPGESITTSVTPPPTPTLTEWGLLALGLLLAGSLAFMIRRRFAPRPAGA